MPNDAYCYSHPRPIMAADSVVFSVRENALAVLLVERGHDPYQGHWALPGGFVNENEPLDTAAARELREETGIRDAGLVQFATFGDPGRDPRGWAVSAVYMALVDAAKTPVAAADDAADARWFAMASLPPLAFDHSRILAYAGGIVQAWARQTGVGRHALPEPFSRPALDDLHRAVTGEVPDAAFLDRVLVSAGHGLFRFRNPESVPL